MEYGNRYGMRETDSEKGMVWEGVYLFFISYFLLMYDFEAILTPLNGHFTDD